MDRLPSHVVLDLADNIIDSFDDVERLLIRINPNGGNPGVIQFSHLNDSAKVINGSSFKIDLKIPKISLGDFSANSMELSNLFTWQTDMETK